MTYLGTLPLSALIPLCFLGGLFIGYGYFRALRETATLFVSGGSPVWAVVLRLGRLSVLATGFFIAVLLGAVALLATFAGVLCAKWIMLRRMREIQT